jgi:hypothetical protein
VLFVGVSAPCWAYEGCRSLAGVGGGMGTVLGGPSPMPVQGDGAGMGGGMGDGMAESCAASTCIFSSPS